MKILYFMEPKMGRSFGGVTNVAYSLSTALAKKVSVTYFPVYAPNIRYITNLLKIFRGFSLRDFDVVHFNMTPGWTQGGYILSKFATMSHASTTISVHGIIQLEHRLYRMEKIRGLTTTLGYCKMVDKIITYSEFMRNRIVTWYRVNPDKIAVIPNGVDIDKFSGCKSEIALEGDPAILYLGHLSKNTDLLIKAVSTIRLELPKLKLHLVGGGDTAALKLLAIKREVEPYVIFHGSVSPKQTPYYYKAAEICVFPWKRDPAGITLLEAMASGTAVIVSKRGGAPEIIRNGKDGILFDPNDDEALPNAILSLHRDQDLRKKIARNALKTVTEYSWENVAKKYISLYQSLRETRFTVG
jgi:glycosyltransferase involved in cell wall biosynthesis